MIERRSFVCLFLGAFAGRPTLSFGLDAAELNESDRDSGIAAKLISEKEVLHVGEVARVNIEVSNSGEHSVILPNWVSLQSQAEAFLELELIDAKGEMSPRNKLIADFFPSTQKTDPIVALLNGWLVLHPNTSFTSALTLSGKDFDFLQKTGKYRLSGFYSTNGLLEPTILGKLGISAEAVKLFPFLPWRGKVATNAVSLRVI
jgi:hypothetical protein